MEMGKERDGLREMDEGKESYGGKERDQNLVAVWRERVQIKWQEIRKDAETYPYVWASYGVVYGFFGIYLAYRWRKLRQTEARVRVLQMQLQKLAEVDEAAAASVGGCASKNPPPAKSVTIQTKTDEKLI